MLKAAIVVCLIEYNVCLTIHDEKVVQTRDQCDTRIEYLIDRLGDTFGPSYVHQYICESVEQ